jgi:hypothetical protein
MDVRTVGNLCDLGPTILMQEVKGATRGRSHRLVLPETQQEPSLQAAFSPSLPMAGAINGKRRREP